MKILHLNAFDSGGGAAIAARRLCEALNSEGISAILGCQQQYDKFPFVRKIQTFLPSKLYKLAQLVNSYLLDFFIDKNNVVYTMPFLPLSLNSWIQKQSPDIIHLHWIAGSFISSFALQKIAELGIPVVWTLHDTWAFTGGCHIKTSCESWKNSCSNCPVLILKGKYDISYWQFKNKKKIYNKLKPYIVVPSQNFFINVQESSLLSSYNANVIPHCCNTHIFKPCSQHIARKILGLEDGKKYILFGAVAASYDKNKGFDLLQKALQYLPDKKDTECLIFGASHEEKNAALPLPTRYLGQLHDEISLALVYAAADVFVCPSREESFSLTTLESIACGTPVAAFSVGGIPDMIQHGVNGMLAKPHDPHDLSQGIAFILENTQRRENMGKAARSIAEKRYAMPVVAKQYIALYKQLLAKNKK